MIEVQRRNGQEIGTPINPPEIAIESYSRRIQVETTNNFEAPVQRVPLIAVMIPRS